MDFSEVVGFLITMAAIIYMFIKRSQDARKRSQTHDEPEDGEHHQAEKLDDFLKSLEIDMKESGDFKPPPKPKVSKPEPRAAYHKAPPPRPLQKQEKSKFRSSIEDFKMKTNIEERKLKVNSKNKYEGEYGDHLLSSQFKGNKIPGLIGYKRASRIAKLIHQLPSKKDIVLLHEVLDKPKGFKF